jgi:hypothetical protein
MNSSDPILDFVVTAHAAIELQRRQISLAEVEDVLSHPEQRILSRLGRHVLQSRVAMEGRIYLLRVFVDTDRAPAEIVTAYRTSNIEKYWRADP